MEPIRNPAGERLDVAFHDASRDDVLLVLGHGVTGNKDRPLLVKIAEALSERGWPCLRISFAGNGDSEGRFEDATVSKECADLRAVLDSVACEGRDVVYCGHSMGGAVGLKVAAKDPRIAGLVTLAGMIRTKKFCDAEFGDAIPGEGRMWGEDGCPLSQAYVDDMVMVGDVFAEVEQIEVPYLLLHGTEDDVVSPDDSSDAFERAMEPKKLVRVDGVGHLFAGKEGQVALEIAVWLGDYFQ